MKVTSRLLMIVGWLILGLTAPLAAGAQTGAPASKPPSGSEPAKPKKSSAWVLSDVLGNHQASEMDTLTYNYQRQAVPSLQSDALATTGNLGGASQNQIYFQRPDLNVFFFENALLPYLPTFQKQKFYNVYIPLTQLSYNFGGSRDTNQDRLKGFFAGNVDRRLGFGASMDYIYSKGSYDKQAAKAFDFGFTGYYRGDRYEVQAFFNQWNHVNKDNGGITDPLYITDPAVLQGGVSKIEAKSIPVNLNNAHTRLAGKQLFLNQDFKVGYWQEEQVNDTLTREIYIPVVKFLHSLDFKTGRHGFTTSSSSDQNFFENHYMSLAGAYDKTTYWELGNTLGMAMMEGFKPWVKFNLTAFATFTTRHFTLMGYESPESPRPAEDEEGSDEPVEDPYTRLPEGFNTDPKISQNLLWVGGRLAKDNGEHFTYNATARFGLLGDVVGDIELEGNVATRLRLGSDTVAFQAHGLFHNSAPSPLLNRYISNNFCWDQHLGKIRRLKVDGTLTIPWTRTVVNAGLENVQNLVYFATDGLPHQNGGSVQVVSVAAQQNLHVGIWNWNNTLTWQISSNQEVLPLPALTLYSNMYLGFKAFRVLDLQIGVDCDYFTRYRGVRYQPATMTFQVGEDWKIGNYAFCNAYITAKLYKVRFYLMMTHVNQGLFTKDFFSMPLYPLNPRRFQLGLSVDFAN